jgi:hypothetical protein
MSRVSEVDVPKPGHADGDADLAHDLAHDLGHEEHLTNPVGTIAIAFVVGVVLAVSARSSALALLVAVAVVQALVAFTWALGTALPGRKGAIVIAALASGAADAAVSVWPNGRLGTLLAVFALAVPVMFVHQLVRGAARVRVVDSLGGVATLVVLVVGLPALLQLRHEFGAGALGGKVVAGVVAAAAGALIVGILVDLVMPAPRFDSSVDRGFLALIAAAGLGGSLGHLMLRSDTDFMHGRGAFVGAAVGALVGLLAVGTAFVEASTAMPPPGVGQRLRPLLGALVPLCLVAPVAFLLCLAIRA